MSNETATQTMTLALGLFSAAAIVFGPVAAAIATATFVAGRLLA
jgi:hypothetical protein